MPLLSDAVPDPALYAMFAKELRPGLFTGFLTISGFLVSAHTFIVVHMKKEVYDHDQFKAHAEERKKANPAHRPYGSLKNLSRLLLASVFASLTASLSQVTVGLWHSDYAAYWCMFAAAVAFFLLVLSVIVMALNMRSWFRFIEQN